MATNERQARRAFLSRLKIGAAAAGLTALAGRGAHAQAAGAAWQPRRHEQDDWLDRIPGGHRFIFDTTAPGGFAEGLTFATNFFNANKSGYGLADADLAVVIVARHHSTPFAYADGMWAKHGAVFSQRIGFVDPGTGKPPTANLHRARIENLVARGAHLAVCQMATRNHAGLISKATGIDPDVIYKELTANLLGNSHMVPAGIVAVNRAQERGYSLAIAV